ncbi:MAG: hypothetical protein KGZ59_06095 [Chitinophagaceae bacterium]|nr:hypothetical protein [Chitinophagaceae bacterium]
MKKSLIYLSLIITIIGLSVTGCYKDTILPEIPIDPDGPPQAVSFNTELKPLLQTKCALSGCHVTGAHKPYLTADVSYQQIVNGGFVNLAVPKQSILHVKLNGEMREYMPSAIERQKVYDWIRNGAVNN